MASRVPPGSIPDLETKLHEMEERIVERIRREYAPAPAPRATVDESAWLAKVLPGVTLLSIIAFAFWLGSLHNTIKQNSEKLDKISGVVLESKDSLTSRTSIIEAKLDSIDKKLTDRLAAPLSQSGQK